MQRRSPLVRSFRPSFFHRHAAAGAALAAIWAAGLGALGCGGGGSLSSGGGGGGGGGGGPTGAPDIVRVVETAQVDLPGRISVLVRVQTVDGDPIADLTVEDFDLLEDGEAVSSFESGQRLLPKPRVFRSYSMLLIDRSGSIVTAPDGEQQAIDAAKAYVERVTENPESFIAVAWFDGSDEITPLSEFSDDPAALLAAIEGLDDEPTGDTSTNLYGAMEQGLDALDAADLAGAADGIAFRSLSLVTFTDGKHRAGGPPEYPSFEEIRDRIAPPGVTSKYSAFTIGVGAEIEQDKLEALGPQGAVFVDDLDGLVPAFDEVAARVRDLANSYYLISYCSPLRAGMHTLGVRHQTNHGVDVEEYLFDASYFGPGCGFLDVQPVAREALAGAASGAAAMLVDASERIVLAGNGDGLAGGPDAWIARLDPAGVLDVSFGTEGVRFLRAADLGVDAVFASALALRSNGRVLVGGWTELAGVARAHVWELAPAGGSITAQFDAPAIGAEGERIRGVALDSAGRVLACGSSTDTGSSSAVWRLTPALQLDGGFNGSGMFLHATNPAFALDVAHALAIDDQDRAIVVGEGFEPGTGTVDLKVFRLSFGGTLDASFSGDGIARNLGTFQSDVPGRGFDVALDAQGRIVVVGSLAIQSGAPPVAVARPALWRFLGEDGLADPSFAGSSQSMYPNTGLVTLRESMHDEPEVDFGAPTVVRALALGPGGELQCAGFRDNAQGHPDAVLWRFTESGILDADYNTVGFLIDDGASGDDSTEHLSALAIHPDGRILAAGDSTPVAGAPEAVLWIDADPARRFPPTNTP